jgi:hypothetical protein
MTHYANAVSKGLAAIGSSLEWVNGIAFRIEFPSSTGWGRPTGRVSATYGLAGGYTHPRPATLFPSGGEEHSKHLLK